jgi:hypothetical protein
MIGSPMVARSSALRSVRTISGGALLLEIEAYAAGRLAHSCHRTEPQRFDPARRMPSAKQATDGLHKSDQGAADQQWDQQIRRGRARARSLCDIYEQPLGCAQGRPLLRHL